MDSVHQKGLCRFSPMRSGSSYGFWHWIDLCGCSPGGPESSPATTACPCSRECCLYFPRSLKAALWVVQIKEQMRAWAGHLQEARLVFVHALGVNGNPIFAGDDAPLHRSVSPV